MTSEPDALMDALVQSAFATMSVLTRVAGEHDLSLTQLRVLGVLRDRRVRMAALAAHLGLEKSTMTGLVDRAERRGLVVRSAAPGDGRAVEVTLSADGHRLAGQVVAQVAAALAPRTGRLTAADARRLAELLGRTVPEAFT